ncbi:minor tail protein [Dinoroseobacter phage vB_DshS-R4C]|nr:minor tail protein [Dinoroseobacter phage vB_DshS-R4C]
MDLDIKHNIAEIERALSDIGRRQLPFAMMLAINKTLQEIQINTVKRLRRALDRPTPFTLRAFAIRRARKTSLRGSIFAKDIQADYLTYAEEGGTRRPRRRVLLQPKGARLNKYGNLARGGLPRIIGRANTFVGAPFGGAGGVWQRMGGKRNPKLRLLVLFIKRATYRRRLGFRGGAERTALARLPGHLSATIAQAIKTARR